jgi:hypothetical protein
MSKEIPLTTEHYSAEDGWVYLAFDLVADNIEIADFGFGFSNNKRLLCPVCGYGYLHTTHSGYSTMEWGGRGDVIAVHFEGECGHLWQMCFGFHKGETFSFVRYPSYGDDGAAPEFETVRERVLYALFTGPKTREELSDLALTTIGTLDNTLSQLRKSANIRSERREGKLVYVNMGSEARVS